MKDIYPPSKEHKSADRQLSYEEIENFREKLKIFDDAVGPTWILSDDSADIDIYATDIEKLLFSEEYMSSNNKLDYFINKANVTLDEMQSTAPKTSGQTNNATWLMLRRNQLIPSYFDCILTAIRRNKYPPSLFK
ncbi:hypothetical protein Trydic_g3957 [Trypoxylus dichotomus]